MVKSEGRINLDVGTVVRRVGLDAVRVHSTIRRASAKGYFEGFPRLVPVEVEPGRIDAAVATFAPFEGQGRWKVTEASLRGFLGQMPPTLREGMLDLLVDCDVLGRDRLARLVTAALAKVPAGSGRKFIVGFSPDSGNHVRTLFEHEASAMLQEQGWAFAKTIREAVDGDTLVLIDDNATSGSQAVCQFMALVGVEEARWTAEQLGERGIERVKLSARDLQTLRSLRLSFATGLGTQVATDHLRAELPEMQLTNFEGLFYGEERTPPSSISSELLAFLEEVGFSLLAWARHGV